MTSNLKINQYGLQLIIVVLRLFPDKWATKQSLLQFAVNIQQVKIAK